MGSFVEQPPGETMAVVEEDSGEQKEANRQRRTDRSEPTAANRHIDQTIANRQRQTDSGKLTVAKRQRQTDSGEKTAENRQRQSEVKQ